MRSACDAWCAIQTPLTDCFQAEAYYDRKKKKDRHTDRRKERKKVRNGKKK